MLVGKGYALDYCFNKIVEQFGDYTAYDGYFIFDADNVIDKNYVKEMNKVFDRGYNVITSYRNSKNYDTNWIDAYKRQTVFYCAFWQFTVILP